MRQLASTAKYKGFKANSSRRQYLDGFFALIFFQVILLVCVSGPVYAIIGDFDDDSDVDFLDLSRFTAQWLNTCGDPNWCDGADLDFSERVDFLDFAHLASNWGSASSPPVSGPDHFTVFNSNIYPTRLAIGPNGNLYVKDAKTDSVFIYDFNFTITGELRRLGKPLGLALDAQGNIYVGSSERKVVEVYNTQGIKTNTIGLGLIEMPSDIAFDNDGKLYVVDSKKNTVWVFNPNGGVLRSIGRGGTGDGEFDLPIALEIAYRGDPGSQIPELYVADRGNYRIHVFDLDGNFKRSFGSAVSQSMMGNWRWQGKFVKLQGLTMDLDENLHVLDSYLNKVQILDPNTGSFLGYYGDSGSAEGQLNLPFDVIVDDYGDSIVTDTGNKRVEIFILTP